MRPRRSLWALSAFCAVLPLAATTAAADRPNILVAIADDWGWPHACAYGDPVVQTPAFDRLARLVDGGARHLDKIGVADGHGQGAVLGKIQQLAGKWWHDNPEGLGKNDQLEHQPGFEADRHGRLGLAMAY